MDNPIVADSAISASGKDVHAPMHEAERLKAEQVEIDTVGLLVKLQPQESLNQAIQRGLLTWQSGPFHRNFTPTECRINSAEAARWQVGASLLGLTVVASDTAREGHLRLCCLVSKG